MKTATLLAAALLVALSAGVADAASKKKPSSSSAGYSDAQRKQIYLQGLELCRRKYGRMAVHRVVVDWKRKRYTCYIY